MHICLDFIPELLSQPDMHKQVFSIELVSFLSLQYALPKSLSIAKLAVSVMTTLLGGKWIDFIKHVFSAGNPSLCQIRTTIYKMVDEELKVKTLNPEHY
jgi:integrator complex subunit 2